MTRWKAALAGLLALALSFAATPPPVDAQVVDVNILSATSGNAANSTISTDVALIVIYQGATVAASATVAVDAATGDLAFLPNETANGVECPVSGALDSDAIDVSDAACNTFGEVCDAINASADWKCVLLDSMRSDTSVNTLATLGATSAKRADGLGLLTDNTVSLTAGRALLPPEMRRMEFYCDDSACESLRLTPFGNLRPYFQWGNIATTYGAGTSQLRLYSVIPTHGPGGSEVEKLEYVRAGGATTVLQEITPFVTTPLLGPPGSKLILRAVNDNTLTATTFAAAGYLIDQAALRDRIQRWTR